MQYYGISESRIKRIIRYPRRIEEGVADNTIAVMQPADSKRYQEIWVMYTLTKNKETKIENNEEEVAFKTWRPNDSKIRIITAWKYPGKSPERDPVPAEIIQEIQTLL